MAVGKPVRLLAINCYDKYDEVRRWIDEARRWLPAWRVRVDCNGDPGQRFQADDVRSFPNRGPQLGTYDAYRFDVPTGCTAVASVHAKCWMSDPGQIDRLADGMLGRRAEAAVITSPHFSDGMNLHLFLTAGDRLKRMADGLPSETKVWPEAATLQAIRNTCRDVWEIPTGMWQYLPEDSLPHFNDEGGREAYGYQIDLLNREEGCRLVSTELRNHPSRRR